MSNTFGEKLKISIFGESHGDSLGVVIDGLPSGVSFDFDKINKDLSRRRGGKKLSTSRIESDTPKIVSGYFNNKTTGTPLCALFENSNTQSKDYEKTKQLLRPSHADYTGYVKYNGFNDYRGGGHFSGRVTVVLVFVGAICKQLLEQYGVNITSHILQLKDVKDIDFNDSNINVNELNDFEYFVDKNQELKAFEIIEKAKNDGDSVGAIVQCCATNVKVGVGEPFFDSLESKIAQLAFSIPAVKGIEFGKGFDFVNGFGSELNDEFEIKEEFESINKNTNNIELMQKYIQTKTNNNGGILGGISNGMPIVYNLAIKPTPSILKEQHTVNIETMTDEVLKVEGRHDPCIAIRVLPVVEAITAIALYELWS